VKVDKAKRGPVKGAEIISKLIAGAEKACIEYLEISGRSSPGYAPESFIQAGAARALSKVGQTLVVLEESVADAYNASQPPAPGRVKSIVSKGRYDIVAYWKNGNPRAAIEVKSPVNALVKQKFTKDFNRLLATMNGHLDASFQYGIFLFLTVKKGIDSDLDKAKVNIKSLVEKLGIEAAALSQAKAKGRVKVLIYEGKAHSLKDEDKQGAWQVSAIVFKR
jgi:hypothetical protein